MVCARRGLTPTLEFESVRVYTFQSLLNGDSAFLFVKNHNLSSCFKFHFPSLHGDRTDITRVSACLKFLCQHPEASRGCEDHICQSSIRVVFHFRFLPDSLVF